MRSPKLPIFIKRFSWAAACCLTTPSLFAVTALHVTTAGDVNTATAGTFVFPDGDLRGVLNHINTTPDTYTVDFSLGASNSITVVTQLPILNLANANIITIDGSNGADPQIIINGNNAQRGFFARQGTITLANLTFDSCRGLGGSGGGGGMGAGGALFIDQANVTISNLTMSNCRAIGGTGVVSGSTRGGGGLRGNSGAGGAADGAGGGGMDGTGGAASVSGGGGGGGIGAGASFPGTGGTGGGAGTIGGGIGGASAGSGAGGGAGGANAGGGGGGGAGNGGGGGGDSGSNSINSVGATGGYLGGGGGGGGAGNGGLGGFGGGGGGSSGSGGQGGFGGGGAHSNGGTPGGGGFGGGGGSNGLIGGMGGVGGGAGITGGGSGAGFGGGIFVNAGGSLTIQGPFTTSIGSNTTVAGSSFGGFVGWHAGNDAFFLTGSTIILDPNGSTITLNNSLADDSAASFAGAPAGVTLGTAAGASVTVQGSGTVVLSQINTYSGGTTINGGTLSLVVSGSLASTGAVSVNSATSVFDISAITLATTIGNLSGVAGSSVTLGDKFLFFGTNTPSTTFAGTISGTGSISKLGTGTQIFSGTNTYTGFTVISGQLTVTGSIAGNVTVGGTGTFNVGNSFTIKSLDGSVGSNAIINGGNTLTFGTSDSTEFEGVISNSGNLIKQGSGTFTVSGTNTFTGTFNVNAGTLNMASTGFFPAASTTNIAAAATLIGTGTLGTVSLNGTVSPGNSIDTLNVGDIQFNAGSNFIVELSNTDSDKIVSSGTVTINSGATLTLAGSGLTSPLPSYLVIDSSMPLVRNGAFTLVSPFTRFVFGIEYTSEDVAVLFLREATGFFAAGNAAGSARCFNTFLANPAPDLLPIIDVLNVQTVAEWQDSFNQMQPSNFNTIAFAQENVAERIRQNFSAHLFEQRVESCCRKPPVRLWFAPFVEHAHQKGKGENKGYKENFRGFTAAIDYQFKNHWTLTSGFSYADSDVGIVHGRGSGDFKTFAGSVGAIWTDSHFFADGLFSYLHSSINAKRKMHFIDVEAAPAFHKTPVFLKAFHHNNSNQLMGHLGGGYDFKFHAGERGTLHLYPFVDVDYINVGQDGYKESGAQSLNLKVRSKTYDLLRPEGGLGLGYAGCFKEVRVNTDVSVSYIREQRFLGKKTKASFENSSCTFIVKGLSPNNNLFSPTFRLTLSSTKATPVSFSIGYHGEFGSRFIENAGEAELKIAF